MSLFGDIRGGSSSRRGKGQGETPTRPEARTPTPPARKETVPAPLSRPQTRKRGQTQPPRDRFALPSEPGFWGFAIKPGDVGLYHFKIERNRRRGGKSLILFARKPGEPYRKSRLKWQPFGHGMEIRLPKPTPTALVQARAILRADNVVETWSKTLSPSSKTQFRQMVRRLEDQWPESGPVERLMAYKGLYELGVVEKGSYYPTKSAMTHHALEMIMPFAMDFLGEDGRWKPEITTLSHKGKPLDLDDLNRKIVEAAAFVRMFPPDPTQQRSRRLRQGKATPEESATVPVRHARRAWPTGALEQRLTPPPVAERLGDTTAKRKGLTRNLKHDPAFDLALWNEALRYGRAKQHLPWLAVLLVSGARRSEIVKGVEVSTRRLRDVRRDVSDEERRDVPLKDGELAFVVQGSKCRDLPVLDPTKPPKQAGQKERSGMFVAIGYPPAEWLRDYVRRHGTGGEVVIRPDFGPYVGRSLGDRDVQRDRTPAEVATAITNLLSRLSRLLDLPENASPHIFRHLRSAVDKAARELDVQGRSWVLGHAADETAIGYGYAHQGKGKGGPPPITQAFATQSVRVKSRPHTTRPNASLRNG